MGKLFGTDGIRGVANVYPMTPELALRVGREVAAFYALHKETARIVIGQDTRISGDMIASALAAGVCAAGGEVHMAGIIPTPAVSYLVRALRANAGIVISASHNPYYDNGIKLFGPDGYKLTDMVEAQLEERILDDTRMDREPVARHMGRVDSISNASEQYINYICKTVENENGFHGLKVVLDCANGATYQVAPTVFTRLGTSVQAIFDNPNGININDNCGSQYPEKLAEAVNHFSADVGLAFDGDGDRLIAVDETGAVLTGDQILAIYAQHLKETNRLRKNRLVTTVMSNMGLKLALEPMGIEHLMADVGDRHVMEMMINSGANLGGEDSGHIIFLDHHTTGDGLLAAVQLLGVMTQTGKPLSMLKKIMTVYPQALINVTVSEKPPIAQIPEIQNEIAEAERRLGARGRVLVRYSGTQLKCRVMVEGPTAQETQTCCELIAEAVRNRIGR